MNNLKPIKLLPARERVASAIRKAILSKELYEGEELTLDGMAMQLGVSSTPVREAFQILSNEGLITLRPNKGARVNGVSKKYIEDHYNIRILLESEAVSILCMNETDLSEVIEVHSQSKKVIDEKMYEEYSNYNQAFHMAIWSATKNEKLVSILSNLWNGLSLGSGNIGEKCDLLSIKEHEEIVRHLIDRDEEKVKILMKNHLLRSKLAMLRVYED